MTSTREETTTTCDRRRFLASTAGTLAAATLGATALNAQQPSPTTPGRHFCVFEKFIQKLSPDQLADTLAEMGFQGVEATVRRRGRIEPERVEAELPVLHEALEKRGLTITMVTTDINRADSKANEKVLKTAAALGVKQYRMKHYRYNLKRPIQDQVAEFRSQMTDLSGLNKDLGIQALYQNHSGEAFFGATVWDLLNAIQGLPQQTIGMAFDIRHAQVEASLAWRTLYRAALPRIESLYVKDYRRNGRKVLHAPLGTSVTKQDVRFALRDNFDKPISLHVEYAPKAGTQANLDANRRDFKLLREWIG